MKQFVPRKNRDSEYFLIIFSKIFGGFEKVLTFAIAFEKRDKNNG